MERSVTHGTVKDYNPGTALAVAGRPAARLASGNPRDGEALFPATAGKAVISAGISIGEALQSRVRGRPWRRTGGI